MRTREQRRTHRRLTSARPGHTRARVAGDTSQAPHSRPDIDARADDRGRASPAEEPQEPAGVPPAGLLALSLQRTVGNAAAARVLRRAPLQRATETASALERIRQINAYTWVGPYDEDELAALWGSVPELEDMLLDSRNWKDFAASLAAGMDLDDIPDCPTIVKIWAIHDDIWVGPRGEAELGRQWRSYGDALPEMIDVYRPTWRTSVRRGLDLADMHLEDSLEADVLLISRNRLERNRADVQAERARLGLDEAEGGPEAAGAQAELLRHADQLRQLLEGRERLFAVQVGWDLAGGADPNESAQWEPAYFDPTRPPDKDPEPDEPQTRSWEEIMHAYGEANRAALALAGTSPVLYSALKEDRVADLSASGADGVAPLASELLVAIAENIEETAEESYDWQELTPILSELADGLVVEGGSGIDWSIYTPIIETEVGDYEATPDLVDFGWLIPAVASIFVPAAWAAYLTVVVSVGEAAYQFERWDDLRAAAGAAAGPAGELIDQGKVDEAQIAAIIALVSAVADVIGTARILTKTPPTTPPHPGGPPPGGGNQPPSAGSRRRPKSGPQPEPPLTRAERVHELSFDPAVGKRTAKTIKEAEDALSLEDLGAIPGPIQRADGKLFPEEAGADFVDAAGQLWDHKHAISRYGFDARTWLDDVQLDLDQLENIIANHEALDAADLAALLAEIELRGLRDRFLWVPPL